MENFSASITVPFNVGNNGSLNDNIFRHNDNANLITVVLVNYNQRSFLDSCIQSIEKQNCSIKIIIVDNGSEDGSTQYLKDNFPEIMLIENIKNIGFGAGNNLGIKYARGDYIVFLNPDTIVEDNWIKELVAPLIKTKRIITTPKILTYDGTTISACGITKHFTGLAFARGLGEKTDSYSESEFVNGLSGCCFAIRKNDFEELSKFDETFFIYHEDVDISWRAYLKGFKILYIPTAIVRHNHTLKVPPKKIYYLERGRYILFRKYLSITDFLILSPSLLLAELLTFGYSIKFGRDGLIFKFKAIKEGLTTKVERVEGDKVKLLDSLSATIPEDQLTYNRAEKLLKAFSNKIFKINYNIFKRLI